MKQLWFVRVSLLTITAMTMVLSAAGQSDNSLIAKIPFTFSVQQEQFAAGEYVIEPLQHGYLRLRSGDNRSVIVHVLPNYSQAKREAKGKLIFWRYGSEYFLRQAWIPSSDFGMNFVPGDRETKLAKELRQQKEEIAVLGR